MFTTMTAQLSTSTLLRLIEYLRTRGGSEDVSEEINTALEFWLDAKNKLPVGSRRRISRFGPVVAPSNHVAPIAACTVPPEVHVQPARAEQVQRADFDPGWNLPERRQFRYRMEDIAY